MRIVILGGGMIAEVHRRAALAAGAQVVAAMASTSERTAELARRWQTEPLASVEALARHAPDVVHVCTPNVLHAPQTRAALQAGAHVICEKPLAVSATEARALHTLAAERRRVATVPFVYRFHPLVRELRQRALDGEFGAWQLLHGSYLQDWLLEPGSSNWRVDPALGGASRTFADIGSHWCDLMGFVTGERIVRVMASQTTTQGLRGAAGVAATVQTEDACALLFRTARGVLGNVAVSQVSAGRKNRLWFEFDGARQSAVFDQEQPETVWLGRADGATTLFRDPQRGCAEQRRLSVLPAGHPQGFAQCFERFVADSYAAMRGEPVDGLPTFDDGLRAAHLIDAVVRSAREERWVDVADACDIPTA